MSVAFVSYATECATIEKNSKLFSALQLVLVRISKATGFVVTFNDCDALSDVEEDMNNELYAVQFYSSDPQPTDSLSSDPDLVPVLAINAMPSSPTSDDMAV